MKIDVFDYPTVVWRPLSRKPLRISAQTLCRQKLELMAYIFYFCPWQYGSIFIQFFVVGSERRIFFVDFGTNRKGVCDSVLVINSNFGPILYRFWDKVSYWLKIANFSYPTLVWRPHSGGTLRISGWKLARKNYKDGTVKIACFNRFWLIHPCDGRTDGIAVAYTALSIASNGKKIAFSVCCFFIWEMSNRLKIMR